MTGIPTKKDSITWRYSGGCSSLVVLGVYDLPGMGNGVVSQVDFGYLAGRA
jgi:hypothetical protein